MTMTATTQRRMQNLRSSRINWKLRLKHRLARRKQSRSLKLVMVKVESEDKNLGQTDTGDTLPSDDADQDTGMYTC